MNIGQAAAASGVTAKMIRYYETIGLIPKAGRTGAGYRLYSRTDVNTLRFIRRARDFGMPMARIELLIGLWLDRDRPSRDVKKIALEHVKELRTKIAELTAMAETLKELDDRCHGDDRPDCPILHDLEGPHSPASTGARTPAQDRVRRSGRAPEAQPRARATTQQFR